jgi:hypothetical protein
MMDRSVEFAVAADAVEWVAGFEPAARFSPASCRQVSRRTDFGILAREPTLSIFQKLWSAVFPARPSRPDLIVHDPDSAKPHDLDDPFFDGKVRERVGAAIAKAALERAKP